MDFKTALLKATKDNKNLKMFRRSWSNKEYYFGTTKDPDYSYTVTVEELLADDWEVKVHFEHKVDWRLLNPEGPVYPANEDVMWPEWKKLIGKKGTLKFTED